jgi:hypothetical protein
MALAESATTKSSVSSELVALNAEVQRLMEAINLTPEPAPVQMDVTITVEPTGEPPALSA